MKLSLRRAAFALALVAPLLGATRSEACGPDCSAEAPREDLKECLAGKLGDLGMRKPGCRAVGFLLLNGKGLGTAERELIGKTLEEVPAYEEDITRPWREARAKVAAQPEAKQLVTDAQFDEYTYYVNCLAGAFEVAAKTLDARVEQFGASSPEVGAWLAAQDRVFQNCSGGPEVALPEPAPQGAPALVQADRAYQTAAAYFYAGQFDEALQRFDAIAVDAASPWRKWARLAAVRSLIRKATLATPDEAARKALFEQARERNVSIVKDPGMKELHRQTRALTWFVDYRLRPEKQLNLLGRVLLEKPDENFGLAWRDYFALRGQHTQNPSNDELSQFLRSFEDKDGYATARDAWKRTKSVAWLAAALSQATAGASGLDELLTASGALSKESPASVTVRAARGRLALEAGRADEARAELLPLLEAGALPPATAEVLASHLLEAAQRFEEWAKYAHLSSRTPDFFTRGVPLARLADEKVLAALEPQVRKAVVLSGWTRAVLMDRWEVASALEPHVEKAAPELAKDLARVRERSKPEDRKMAAVVLLLKAPGLSPYVHLRADPVLEFSYCEGNGWCPSTPSDYYADCEAGKKPCPRFLSAEERKAVKQEGAAVATFGKTPDVLIRHAITYANKNPNDPLVPEALHYGVRQTRYAHNDYCGADDGETQRNETSKLSKESFRLLHKKYAKTEWAKKTPHHF